MADRGGIRSLLAHPALYDFMQNAVGVEKLRRVFFTEYVRAAPGDGVLDIGCGTGTAIDFLPQVDFHGVDANEKYIRAARRRYGERGVFTCAGVADVDVSGLQPFRIVTAMNVLHHLNDDEAAAAFRLARAALAPGGRFVVIDPCFSQNQSRAARFLISIDRGSRVRMEEENVLLAERFFDSVTPRIRHDLLRIPYTHIIMECA